LDLEQWYQIDVYSSKDDNILEIYLQISHIFLAIVVKHLIYTEKSNINRIMNRMLRVVIPVKMGHNDNS